MRIVLIRHFRVDFNWKFWYNSVEYDAAREGYNVAAVVKTSLSYKSNDRLITSTMGRSRETSRLIFERDPHFETDAICEVPIKAFANIDIRLPKFVWDIIGRLQWRLNSSSQPESYAQSKARVHEFLTSIFSHGHDCVIVCHGWIMKIMIRKLKASGFIGPSPIYIKNGVPYEFLK